LAAAGLRVKLDINIDRVQATSMYSAHSINGRPRMACICPLIVTTQGRLRWVLAAAASPGRRSAP